MKVLRQLFATMLLAFVLSVCAYAGDIQMPGINSSSPPSGTSSAMEPGDMGSGGMLAVILQIVFS